MKKYKPIYDFLFVIPCLKKKKRNFKKQWTRELIIFTGISNDIYLSYLPTPPLVQDMTRSQFFKQSLTGFNSEFSFSLTSCLTKAEEPILP